MSMGYIIGLWPEKWSRNVLFRFKGFESGTPKAGDKVRIYCNLSVSPYTGEFENLTVLKVVREGLVATTYGKDKLQFILVPSTGVFCRYFGKFKKKIA